MKRAALPPALAQQARWLAPLVALGVAVGVLLFDGDAGAFALLGLRSRVAAADSHVRAAEARREDLYQSIGALRRDDLAIEAAAREQLGMLRDGELVLRWADPPAHPSAPEPRVNAAD